MQRLPPSKRQRGVAFGSGVADEDDVYGMVSFTLIIFASGMFKYRAKCMSLWRLFCLVDSV